MLSDINFINIKVFISFLFAFHSIIFVYFRFVPVGILALQLFSFWWNFWTFNEIVMIWLFLNVIIIEHYFMAYFNYYYYYYYDIIIILFLWWLRLWHCKYIMYVIWCEHPNNCFPYFLEQFISLDANRK